MMLLLLLFSTLFDDDQLFPDHQQSRVMFPPSEIFEVIPLNGDIDALSSFHGAGIFGQFEISTNTIYNNVLCISVFKIDQ